MQTELEAKFLNVNLGLIRARLTEQKAILIHSEQLMRRRNFDYPDGKLEKIGGWIRVRDEGDKITLAYKQLINRTISGTKELSLIVENFDTISDFFLAIGLVNKSYQETKRERWDFNGTEITIDTWPWIPSFIEIEGLSEDKIKDAAHKLGLDWSKALHGSVENAYQAYYDISEAEVDSWENIIFSDIPEWLVRLKK